ncbi:MAG TPA: hypothetical protein VET23_15955 [Chitinophagaceae bacterium]|nr:hypothetical protein [Chitinophagaceae bacterium]
MKPQINYQEILMFTGTSFSKKQLCELNEATEKSTALSPAEQLEKACWAGLLFDLLPELVNSPTANDKSYIWNILAADHFICINLSPYPFAEESKTSIDPYSFLSTFSLT